MTDYGLPSLYCGQDFQESEADSYKRKKAVSALFWPRRVALAASSTLRGVVVRAGYKCVEALGRIIIRGQSGGVLVWLSVWGRQLYDLPVNSITYTLFFIPDYTHTHTRTHTHAHAHTHTHV